MNKFDKKNKEHCSLHFINVSLLFIITNFEWKWKSTVKLEKQFFSCISVMLI